MVKNVFFSIQRNDFHPIETCPGVDRYGVSVNVNIRMAVFVVREHRGFRQHRRVNIFATFMNFSVIIGRLAGLPARQCRRQNRKLQKGICVPPPISKPCTTK